MNINHHSNYNFNDFQKYIQNIAYIFANKTNIDIDEFISEAGLVWTTVMTKHDPEKSNFIAYFKKAYRQSCLTLIKKQFTQKAGGDYIKISLDRPLSNDNDLTLHNFLTNKKIKSDVSDICLLSDSAKQVLKALSDYWEPTNIINVQRKKMINNINSNIKKKIGVENYHAAINEICNLIPGAQPAKQRNTLPIILKKG